MDRGDTHDRTSAGQVEGIECEAVYWAANQGNKGPTISAKLRLPSLFHVLPLPPSPSTSTRPHPTISSNPAPPTVSHPISAPPPPHTHLLPQVEVERLLAQGMNPNYKHGRSCLTPLFAAVNNNHRAVIEVLVRDGADINAKLGREGSTVLHSAAIKGDRGMVVLLVESGANLGVTDNQGKTASEVAKDNNKMDVLDYLNTAQMNALLSRPADVVAPPLAAGGSFAIPPGAGGAPSSAAGSDAGDHPGAGRASRGSSGGVDDGFKDRAAIARLAYTVDTLGRELQSRDIANEQRLMTMQQTLHAVAQSVQVRWGTGRGQRGDREGTGGGAGRGQGRRVCAFVLACGADLCVWCTCIDWSIVCDAVCA